MRKALRKQLLDAATDALLRARRAAKRCAEEGGGACPLCDDAVEDAHNDFVEALSFYQEAPDDASPA